MGRKLKEIEVQEISLVDAAANRKKFLIVKKELGEGAGIGGPRQGLGGAKYCVCPKCGYSIEHAQIGEGKSKPCAQIKCPECGTKMVGSKTKELSKLKKKAHISIDSDGTIKGTKILVDGKEIKDITDFYFSFYKPNTRGDEVAINPISCSYSRVTESEDGFKHTDTFYLSKSLEVIQMKELKEIYKDLTDEEFSEEQIKKVKKLSEEAQNVIKKALNSLGEYKNDMPQDLRDAVKILAKNAIGSGAEEIKKSDEPYKLEEVLKALEKVHLEKAGAKLSKNTRQQIQKAIDALKKLIENDLKKDDGNPELKKELEEIKKAVDKLTEKDAEDSKKELKDLKERLEVIEKAKGIKKSIDGNGEKEKDDKVKWPSFSVLDEE